MLDLVVRGGDVVTPEGTRRATIAVADGTIEAVVDGDGADIAAAREIDARGKLVIPGVIDAHVHFRDPGITHKEDFGSGSSAAALGGVTTVMVMPTDVPPTLTADELSEKRAAIEGRSHVDFMLQAAVGPDASTVPALAEAGAVSFEFFLADMADRMRLDDDARLLEAFEAVRGTGLVAGVSPGSHALHALFLARAKEAHGPARSGWLASRPPLAEALGVARAVLTARHAGARVHIRQTSTAAAVAILAAHRGPDVTAEATPHNLLLDDGAFHRLGPVAKIAPPLRDPADVAAIVAALADGTVTMVATDHAPHAPEEKAKGENDVWAAPGGFPGVQTMLPLTMTLVERGAIDLAGLVRVLCEAPARTFGLWGRKGALAKGFDADMAILDPARPFTIRNAEQASKAGLTPFDGTVCPATPVATLLRGKAVMEDGRVVGEAAGRFLAPSR